MAAPKPRLRTTLLNATVLVAALGYFVDIYDLVLFSIVRVPSLKSLGAPEDQLLQVGWAVARSDVALPAAAGAEGAVRPHLHDPVGALAGKGEGLDGVAAVQDA